MLSIRIYHAIKPLLPRRLQLALRRVRARRMLPSYTRVWPIYEKAGKPPVGWSGWPERKKFALVLVHSVETSKGREKCKQLIRMEERLGFRSAFYFVPRRYEVSPELRHCLISKGFEVGVHGLKHDGKLYKSRTEFKRRAVKINKYLKEWNSHGFNSPSMHHNLEWIHDLNIQYDISTYDTDPFEPQGGGIGTIFPFCVPGNRKRNGYIELPYTMPQDLTLFVLMKERGTELWKKKLDWIAKCGGMALWIVHPDYMNWDSKRLKLDEYPAEYYEEFLNHIKSKHHGQYWHVLPQELARFWAKNMKSIESKVP